MDTLQTLACRSYLQNCRVGARVPFDIPGSLDSWLSAWMDSIGFEEDKEVFDFVIECIHHGSATRRRASYPFRKRVEVICDTIGINRGPHKRSSLSDVVIMMDPGFTWKKKRVTRTMMSSWDEFGGSVTDDEEMDV